MTTAEEIDYATHPWFNPDDELGGAYGACIGRLQTAFVAAAEDRRIDAHFAKTRLRQAILLQELWSKPLTAKTADEKRGDLPIGHFAHGLDRAKLV